MSGLDIISASKNTGTDTLDVFTLLRMGSDLQINQKGESSPSYLIGKVPLCITLSPQAASLTAVRFFGFILFFLA